MTVTFPSTRIREINWPLIAGLLFCLLAWGFLFSAATAEAQEVSTEAESVDTLYLLEPSESVRLLWDRVVECAGPKRDTTKTFEQIIFIERGASFTAEGDSLLGEWVSDTIFLTRGYETDGWIVAHEMLHHALNGPPEGDPHPLDPFLFPCRLMELQHEPTTNTVPEPIHLPGTTYMGEQNNR